MITVSEGAALPKAALVVALVVGAVAGFAGGRASAPASAPGAAGLGCARSSGTPADVEAAYDLLLQAQMFIESGDLTAATVKASEAQARSGTAKGHFLLGRVRLQAGDVAAGLTHFRCVMELGPSGDEAKYVAAMMSSVK